MGVKAWRQLAAEGAFEVPNGPRSTPRVLVVDDEKVIVEILADFLELAGYEVATARDGEEGLNAWRALRPDVVLTDLKMPKLGGTQLIRRIVSEDPRAVAIAMTGFGTVENAIETMKAGAVEYILKPFKVEEIFAKLSQTIRAVRLEAENVLLERLTARAAELGHVAAKDEPSVPRRPGSTSRVLVVDDEKLIVDLLADFLSMEGYDVETARGGEEGWRAWRARRSDVALIDFRMPEVGGVELVRRIAAEDPRAMLVMMSGFGTYESARETAGVFDCVLKPFKVDEIAMVVGRALRFSELELENAARRALLARLGAALHEPPLAARTLVHHLMVAESVEAPPFASLAGDRLLREAAAVLRPRLPANVELREAVASSEPRLVQADQHLMTAILGELVDNAVAALGGSRGAVSLGFEARAGGEAAFTVSDSGPGFAAAARVAILTGPRASDPGAGLGLALAARACGRMHGRLLIETRPEGTTAVVVVPAVLQSERTT